MEAIIKLNNLTSGREKLARLVQYSCRALWYVLQQYQLSSKNSVNKFKSLEYTFSTFRKLLRFGRFVEQFYVALKMLNQPDQIVCFTSTMSNISHAIFLLCDHVLWIGRSGLMNINSQKWSTLSNRYWLYSIILNLFSNYYELKKLTVKFSADVKYLMKNHKNLVMDTVKNGCDIFIPLTALGYLKFNPGLIGLFGMISSLAGIMSLVDHL